MKLKGLKQARIDAEIMQEVITEKIDDVYDTPQQEEKEEFYNDAWMLLDSIMESFDELIEMKMENYLN